jgi:hypothetical protein
MTIDAAPSLTMRGIAVSGIYRLVIPFGAESDILRGELLSDGQQGVCWRLERVAPTAGLDRSHRPSHDAWPRVWNSAQLMERAESYAKRADVATSAYDRGVFHRIMWRYVVMAVRRGVDARAAARRWAKPPRPFVVPPKPPISAGRQVPIASC